MSHPLDGALAHEDRADRDFDELKSLLEKFIKENGQHTLSNYDPRRLKGISSFELSGVRSFDFPAVPFEAAVLVSAIIHHLRAPLDYLVYELALEDSGIIQNGTQFIIEANRADPKNPGRGFDGRAKSKLIGLSPAHIAIIEGLQPYNGATWTATLRDISNPDKHRKLTVIEGSQTVAHTIELGEPGSFKGRHGPTGRGLSGGPDIHMDLNSSVYVGFPEMNNIRVLETLEIIKREVRATLDSFRSEFK
jgi:hypothetical protein